MMRFAFVHYDPFWKDYKDLPAFRELIENTYHNYKQKTVEIKSDTKEVLEICLEDFIYAEAQDNYTSICCCTENKISKKIIRASLSNIEQQLPPSDIVRCHRSYLVNINAGFHLLRSNNRSQLKHPDLDILIPVSRSKEKEARQVLCR